MKISCKSKKCKRFKITMNDGNIYELYDSKYRGLRIRCLNKDLGSDSTDHRKFIITTGWESNILFLQTLSANAMIGK